MVFTAAFCRQMKLRISRFGIERIDMSQVVNTQMGVTSTNFKGLHHPSIFA